MLLASVRAFIQKHRLLTRGQTLAVGVSGGPDSLALLHLLTRLRTEYDLDLRAAHLHHGLRPDADADAEFVAKICDVWDVPCVIERADIAALAKADRLSVEEAGRRARYLFFARVAPVVAVAHNADDQVETVLMHLLRGAGMAGLRGMLPKSRGPRGMGSEQVVIRPLLATPRADIEAYVAAHGLQPRIDSTNADTGYFRNRLRHELIPFLETYNPKVREIIRRAAEVTAGEYELLHGVVEKAWNDTLAAPSGGAVTFDLRRWRAQPMAMQRELLRRAVAHLRAGLRDIDFVPIDHAVEWSNGCESGHAADLLAGLCVRIVGAELIVCAWADARPSPVAPMEAALAVPGVTRFLEWQATATPLTEWSLAAIQANPDPWTAYIDASLAPLTLRTRRAGDRFRPLGMGGAEMKLSDFMINQKIPLGERDRWPLLASGDAVLWVCGHHLSERAKVTKGTKNVTTIKMEKAAEVE